jgi:hypothetical protein
MPHPAGAAKAPLRTHHDSIEPETLLFAFLEPSFRCFEIQSENKYRKARENHEFSPCLLTQAAVLGTLRRFHEPAIRV